VTDWISSSAIGSRISAIDARAPFAPDAGWHDTPGEDLEQMILRYVRLYNGQLPQSVLKGRTPIDALKNWHRHKPELFKKRPYNHAGCDK